ncbi:hypothetical protein AB0392_40810 [Nonomuraea angiospora]|uniref:hypothetical protein n=1 Tax=Nonomuraea angiospora TaxID=46172 RepID=UPI00344CB309
MATASILTAPGLMNLLNAASAHSRFETRYAPSASSIRSSALVFLFEAPSQYR